MRATSVWTCGVVVAGATFASVAQVCAVPIAYWDFEPNAFLADSSGNGHTLSNTGAVSSNQVPSGTGSTGSAEFDGADIMRTVNSLDLSGFESITVSWYQFVDNGKVAIMFEHSPDTNTNVGGFELTVNEMSSDGVSTGVGRPVLRTNGGYNGDNQTHAIGAWEFFTMAIDLTATTPSQIVEVSNAVEDSNQNADVAPFRNDFFHIGNRFSNLGLGFVGNIDDLHIDGTRIVPEPGTLSLVGLGAAMMIRRRQRQA